MKNGNACWKQEKVDTGLIKSDIQLSKFTIRDYIDYFKKREISLEKLKEMLKIAIQENGRRSPKNNY